MMTKRTMATFSMTTKLLAVALSRIPMTSSQVTRSAMITAGRSNQEPVATKCPTAGS